MIKARYSVLLVILIPMLINSCTSNPLVVDVSGVEVNKTFKRFDQELFQLSSGDKEISINELRSRYGSFYDVFIHRIINLPEGSDSTVAFQLRQFVNDPEVLDIFRLSDSVYKDVSDLEGQTEIFLKHLHYYFPEKPIPAVVTYVSAFNYAVITTDSVIGLGLDMFLGDSIAYYPRMGIPKYMFSKFRREYIVPSLIKAWFQSEYDLGAVKNEFLSQMIYHGKRLYYSKAMVPEMNDSLLSGYSSEQLKWCEANEANIWSFFIENKMLFNTDPGQFAKFVNDGPATGGFPKEAPGSIGTWVGWQIVKAYALKNSDVSLQDIMNENDAQKILEKSAYKPKK